jgi:hypothetical protein
MRCGGHTLGECIAVFWPEEFVMGRGIAGGCHLVSLFYCLCLVTNKLRRIAQ